MVETNDIQRPPKDLIAQLSGISSATAAGELARLGIPRPSYPGPGRPHLGQARRRPSPDLAVYAQARRPVCSR